jgi:hypothetical protein
MTTFTRTFRLAFATGAALALMATAAQAKPLALSGGPAHASTSSVVRMGTYTPVAPINPSVPDRVDRIGGATQITQSQLPPDRVDQLGTAQGPTLSTPTVIATTSGSGFDWVAAAIGAGSSLAFVLIAAAGLAARGRRRVVPSS